MKTLLIVQIIIILLKVIGVLNLSWMWCLIPLAVVGGVYAFALIISLLIIVVSAIVFIVKEITK